MGERYIRQEEIRIIKEALLNYKKNITTDADIEFNNKLNIYQKLDEYIYNDIINSLKLIDNLYDDLNSDKITMVIEDE